MNASTVLVVLLVVMLFTNMVLASMAAADAKKGPGECTEGCHKYSTMSAVLSGLTVLLFLVGGGLLVYAKVGKVALKGALRKGL